MAKADETKAQKAKREKAEKAAAQKAEEKAAREAAREEAKAAKVAEREQAIKDGDLIEGKGGVEFHRVTDKKKVTLDERAAAIVKDLQGSKTPLLGKDLHEKHGGVWGLYIPVFSTLKALGLVIEYRQRTGERGGSGVAYLWAENLG